MKTSGQVLVDTLVAHGLRRAYCVAGESYLPVLDAFLEYPDFQGVTCRHESGVTFMAEAEAQLTGRVSAAFVTRGPGACNASIGVHAAMQASTPMILFIGLIRIEDRDKEAFQAFDVPSMFGSLSKWAGVIDQPERMAEYVNRAVHIATSGRPGPVVLGLPEDILDQAVAQSSTQSYTPRPIYPSAHDLAQIQDLLSEAQNPLVLVGGSGWSDEACADLESFVSACHLPVVASFRRQDIIDHGIKNYIGELGTGPNPALVERVRAADVVLVLNARLNEMAMQSYTLFRPEQKIIHVHPSPEVFGKAYAPTMAIQAHIAPTVSALAAEYLLDGRSWAGWLEEGRAAYQQWTEIPEATVSDWQGADMTQIFGHLRDVLPRDGIITTDAGNFSGWCQRYLRYGRPGRLCGNIAGAMGYAVPAAVAASLAYPDRLVVGFCGDGGFMMTGQELATAMHHGAKPVIMLCNNNMYGTIHMHQQRDFPGRASATALTNPDFVKMAESYGAFTARVENADDFPKIWEQMRAADTLSVIEIAMDPRQITTQAKL